MRRVPWVTGDTVTLGSGLPGVVISEEYKIVTQWSGTPITVVMFAYDDRVKSIGRHAERKRPVSVFALRRTDSR